MTSLIIAFLITLVDMQLSTNWLIYIRKLIMNKIDMDILNIGVNHEFIQLDGLIAALNSYPSNICIIDDILLAILNILKQQSGDFNRLLSEEKYLECFISYKWMLKILNPPVYDPSKLMQTKKSDIILPYLGIELMLKTIELFSQNRNSHLRVQLTNLSKQIQDSEVKAVITHALEEISGHSIK